MIDRVNDPLVSRVYVIMCEREGLAKIGYTQNRVGSRVSAIQSASPVPVTLFGFIYLSGRFNAKLFERHCHKRLDMWRSHGEWFCYRGAAKNIIDAIAFYRPGQPQVVGEDRLLFSLYEAVSLVDMAWMPARPEHGVTNEKA